MPDRLSRGLTGQLEVPTEAQRAASENSIRLFLEKFPEYMKTLRLALNHEESAPGASSYLGWQWHNVDTHPTKLVRLVTEGISRLNLKTRRATYYLLRDRRVVKKILSEAP